MERRLSLSSAGSARTSPRVGETGGAARARVLIVDDLADMRFLLRSNLEHRGFMVVGEAADPAIAEAMAAEHRPDGVIIDMHIPGHDSMASICRLREALPDARILAVSASAGDSDVGEGAVVAGADAYFDKAAGFSELVRSFSALFT